ncbi:MAG: transcription antitermination factor NusB [Lachnospiraceae bacterium]
MTRRELRENTFKMLFRKDFYEESELEEQFALFADSFKNPMTEKDRMYIHDRTAEIFSKIEEIDQAINEVSEGWKTGRMSKVDLTIMRLAYYEMKIDDDIPVSVAINEAVELAKKFGGDDSPSFVNGILAKLTD